MTAPEPFHLIPPKCWIFFLLRYVIFLLWVWSYCKYFQYCVTVPESPLGWVVGVGLVGWGCIRSVVGKYYCCWTSTLHKRSPFSLFSLYMHPIRFFHTSLPFLHPLSLVSFSLLLLFLILQHPPLPCCWVPKAHLPYLFSTEFSRFPTSLLLSLSPPPPSPCPWFPFLSRLRGTPVQAGLFNSNLLPSPAGLLINCPTLHPLTKKRFIVGAGHIHSLRPLKQPSK